ncbi:putative 3-hydroxybutyryl-CoA dehydratase [Leptospira fainei serovar Hurstbridge str. BUT 6]|uniref:3-hydroxybutyryl-CoA dehydratase n=1 Tax=Leptospira fainei serovar Hurstbridge str. BUT 6 TaxID=1193011 RepID=S3V4V6_9LEPT|nr:enoyl-CoA hydratase-related protein [Leptospira fainei]EPG76463.1 putative 3-hydroxybutyryl-CoA dehydratase [Leptospira fainei serovar Hurstbridge str. BUT 6]
MSEILINVTKEGAVALLEINRPSALNALNEELLIQIKESFQALEKDGTVRVAIVTGQGKAFVAGADIAKMRDLDAKAAEIFSRTGQEAFDTIQNSGIVSIAAVNGFALGGGLELALACDIRVGAEKAKLGLPEVSLGLIPGFGGTQRLARLIGYGRAIELVLTGDMISAEEAYRIGLLNKFVKDGEDLISVAKQIAQSLLKKGPIAVKTAKKIVQEGLDGPLSKGIEAECKAFGGLFAGKESKEGMAAFLEKRQPNF